MAGLESLIIGSSYDAKPLVRCVPSLSVDVVLAIHSDVIGLLKQDPQSEPQAGSAGSERLRKERVESR